MRSFALVLLLAACGSKESDKPAVGSATKAPPPPPAVEGKVEMKPFELAGLGLTGQAPACATVSEDATYHTAQLNPSEPGCPLPLALLIRRAEDDFAAGAKALEFATKTMAGTNPVETKTADGYRLDYDKAGGKKGLVINRTLGGTSINCRGEGRARELTMIESICGSLAVK